jgi:hypothetical protein
MELVESSFERALIGRLRAELDALNVAGPAAFRPYLRRRRARYVWAVGRTLAVGLAVALLLGSVAAFASGSTNPATWVKDAGQSFGILPSDDQAPIGGPDESPSPHPSESSEPKQDTVRPTGTGHEPVETQSPEPTERQSPEPSDSSGPQSPGDT